MANQVKRALPDDPVMVKRKVAVTVKPALSKQDTVKPKQTKRVVKRALSK